MARAGFGDELQKPEAGKKIQVFLFAGQSNMEGRADGRKLMAADRARLKNVQQRIQFAFNGEPLRPLDVVAPDDDIRQTYQRDRIFGPELFFGIALAEALPNERFLFIKRALSSTTLHGCWNPDWSEERAALMDEAKRPRMYRLFADDIQKVLAGYAPGDYDLRAMLWVQGEGDRKVPEASAAYGTTLHTLIDRVRADTKRPDLPFLMFEVATSPQVIEGMRQNAAKVPNVTLIPQSQAPASPDFYHKMENGHYDEEGMKKLGTRFAEVYLRTYAAPQKPAR